MSLDGTTFLQSGQRVNVQVNVQHFHFTDDEVDALQDAIEYYCLSMSMLDLQTNLKLEGVIRALESAGLKLGMELG